MIDNRFVFTAIYSDKHGEEEITVNVDGFNIHISYIIYKFIRFLEIVGFPKSEIDKYLVSENKNPQPEAAPNTVNIDMEKVEKTLKSKKALHNFKVQLMDNPTFLKSVFKDFLIQNQVEDLL